MNRRAIRRATFEFTPLAGGRTALAGLLLGAWLACVGCSRKPSTASEEAPKAAGSQVFRIVRPKQLVGLSVLEKHGTLEKDLAPLGFTVQWLEFAAGPQQLEALNAGALDLALTAESPPVFVQAAQAGGPLVYLATTASNGKTVSLLVHDGSPIKTLADLKGKKIAFQKASIGHYLLVKALESVGLTLGDVQSVFLPPPDANAAFSAGSVDAWLIWEPFPTRVVDAHVGHVLVDGERLRDTANFYTTTRAFVDAHSDVLKIFLADLDRAETWSTAHPREMAELLSPTLLIDVPTLLQMHGKYQFGVRPISEPGIVKQQEVADLWFRLGFLPSKVDVRAGFLPLTQYAALMPIAAAPH
ncbi:MAG TPA: aliphatic sulfonate ABC transporter substrate-binding protein [Polyangiaceae bacterium]